MVILLTIAGTLTILAAVWALYNNFRAWRLLEAVSGLLQESMPIVEAFYQQQREAMKMMGGEPDEDDEPGFGVNQ